MTSWQFASEYLVEWADNEQAFFDSSGIVVSFTDEIPSTVFDEDEER